METKQESLTMVQTFGDGKQEPSWQATTDLGDPTYWLSYEYKQMQTEMVKLNEKMDLILSIIQKKPRKNTISEVNSKMDNLIEIIDKKRKLDD